MNKTRDIAILTDRLQNFSSELRAQSPEWADRLEQATTEQDLRNLVCDLFNLSHALPSDRKSTREANTLAGRITRFINETLHRGLTRKVLADLLGYPAKYCSDLFYRIMGESFFGHMRRHRVERAKSLLTTTAQTLAEVAAAVGFSDQFAFSHSLKRATGRSPIGFRAQQSRRPQRQPTSTPHNRPTHGRRNIPFSPRLTRDAG
ncbi:MAG: helix-turn-helix transcriptional regulator [Nitrospira sp.]|nr:helix-turn-helix transcriptional regulator [Nitrospira sp.]